MEATSSATLRDRRINFQFNAEKATRGLHMEPWVSVANGSVFGAWVDSAKASGQHLLWRLQLSGKAARAIGRS